MIQTAEYEVTSAAHKPFDTWPLRKRCVRCHVSGRKCTISHVGNRHEIKWALTQSWISKNRMQNNLQKSVSVYCGTFSFNWTVPMFSLHQRIKYDSLTSQGGWRAHQVSRQWEGDGCFSPGKINIILLNKNWDCCRRSLSKDKHIPNITKTPVHYLWND